MVREKEVTEAERQRQEKEVKELEEEDLGIYEDEGENGLSDTENESSIKRASSKLKTTADAEADKTEDLEKEKSRDNENDKVDDVDQKADEKKIENDELAIRGSGLDNNEKRSILKSRPSAANKEIRFGKEFECVKEANQGYSLTPGLEDSQITSRADYVPRSGVRGTLNTPASTVFDEMKYLKDLEFRLGADSRQSLFTRASTRALKSQGAQGNGPLFCMQDQGNEMTNIPQYFYIQQHKPVPMPPLKAWRGYNGNVYFEPIKIGAAKPPGPETPYELQRNLQQSRATHSRISNLTDVVPRSSNQSPIKPEQRKMAVLDKDSVLAASNPQLMQEIEWIEGTKAVGTLRSEPTKKEKFVYRKTKILKGSVARNMSRGNPGNSLLSVSGDNTKIPKTNTPAPLIRAQTQYSNSNQRISVATPDLSLPPLEQLRLSIKHYDSARKETLIHIIPPLERLKYEDPQLKSNKPFVKYSHDVTKSVGYTRQATI